MTEDTDTNIQDKKLSKFTNILLALSAVVLIFGVGYRLGEYQTKKSANQNISKSVQQSAKQIQEQTDMQLFWSVWSMIKEKYADQSKVKPQQMMYGAIKGLVASLEDPYSYFLTPSENQQSKDDLGGKYEGIGAELGMRDNRIIVVSPLDNSPAKLAGLKSGDIILKVDDKITKDWPISKAVDNIRGEHGTTVKLTIWRDNKELQINIKRQQIKVDSIKLSYKKAIDCKKNCKTVGYIKVTNFGDNTTSEWDRAVLEVAKKYDNKDISGLVVDVRGNPGGYLDGSVYLASEFLPLNSLVIKQQYADESAKDYLVTSQGDLPKIPLVVLIDEGSASASEIFAGALRDHKRATLVGRKSFGKGSVQEAIDLNQNTGLHLTIAKWILPNGDWINSKGIEPDINLELKIEEGNTIEDKTDAQLQRAISEVLKN